MIEFALVAPLFFGVFLGCVDAGLWAVETGATVNAAEQATRIAVSAFGSPSGVKSDVAAGRFVAIPVTNQQLYDSVKSQLQPALLGSKFRPWCAAPECTTPINGDGKGVDWNPSRQDNELNSHREPTRSSPFYQQAYPYGDLNCLTGGKPADTRYICSGLGSSTCPIQPSAVEAAMGGDTVTICMQVLCNTAAGCVYPGEPCIGPICDPPSVEVHVIGYFASLVPPADNLGFHAGEIPINIGFVSHSLQFAR